jgi:ArsR family transcriptional regulator, nickel/cobalt-responsive transcriptional repressor
MAAPMTGSHAPGSGVPLSREAAERLADTMFALAAPSRLLILAALRDGPRTVSELIAVVGMEQSAVSHQLRVLRDHGVVSVERRGRERLYGLRDEDVGGLLDHALAHVLELDGAGGARIKRDRLDRAG